MVVVPCLVYAHRREPGNYSSAARAKCKFHVVARALEKGFELRKGHLRRSCALACL